MIIIELEGVEYQLPQKWEEVNLEMFEKVYLIRMVYLLRVTQFFN